MSSLLRRPALLAPALVLTALHSFAQVPQADQLRRPSEVPLPLPEREQPAPKLQLPPPPVSPGPSLSQGAQFQARAFRFVGNTIFAEAELQAIAEPFVGRTIGNQELDDLRLRITRRYVDAGYINSGAVIPDQDVTDGVVTLRIVEGRLGAIAVGGAHHYDPDFLRERIRYGAPGVLNVERLQEHMQVLLQDPLIERVSAELGPGAELGEAVLRADVTSAPLFLGGVTLSNERSPAVGPDQAEGHIAMRNVFGRGEVLYVHPAYTDGLRDLAFGATVPISARGTALSLRVERTRSRIVETPLDQLDITARSRSIEAGLQHPLLQQPRRTLNASLLLARRDTKSFFLGEPSPFIPGASDGRTTASVLRLGLDGVDRSAERVLAARLQVSLGLDAFGATITEPGIADSRFTAWLAQFQWLQRTSASGSHLVVRADVQRANDALLGPEKYSLGGMDSVRGYRKDLLVRDSGWSASIEYRHLLGHLPLMGVESGEGPIHAALFFDTGSAWNHHEAGGRTHLHGIGPGLRWEPVAGMALQAYYGKALNKVDTATRTTQDRGLHFRFAFSRPF